MRRMGGSKRIGSIRLTEAPKVKAVREGRENFAPIDAEAHGLRDTARHINFSSRARTGKSRSWTGA